MRLEFDTTPIPLETDADSVVHVGGTRVTLDTLVAAFLDGATAEEIAQQYPALRLADIYAVLGYYLKWRPTVDIYLRERQVQAETVRAQNEALFNPKGVRERLLARPGVLGATRHAQIARG